MDYSHITGFLDKFRKILNTKSISQDAISEVVSKHINFKISVDMIKTKNGIIYIQGSPLLKNEILMHKQKILNEVSFILQKKEFTDIK